MGLYNPSLGTGMGSQSAPRVDWTSEVDVIMPDGERILGRDTVTRIIDDFMMLQSVMPQGSTHQASFGAASNPQKEKPWIHRAATRWQTWTAAVLIATLSAPATIPPTLDLINTWTRGEMLYDGRHATLVAIHESYQSTDINPQEALQRSIDELIQLKEFNDLLQGNSVELDADNIAVTRLENQHPQDSDKVKDGLLDYLFIDAALLTKITDVLDKLDVEMGTIDHNVSEEGVQMVVADTFLQLFLSAERGHRFDDYPISRVDLLNYLKDHSHYLHDPEAFGDTSVASRELPNDIVQGLFLIEPNAFSEIRAQKQADLIVHQAYEDQHGPDYMEILEQQAQAAEQQSLLEQAREEGRRAAEERLQEAERQRRAAEARAERIRRQAAQRAEEARRQAIERTTWCAAYQFVGLDCF